MPISHVIQPCQRAPVPPPAPAIGRSYMSQSRSDQSLCSVLSVERQQIQIVRPQHQVTTRWWTNSPKMSYRKPITLTSYRPASTTASGSSSSTCSSSDDDDDDGGSGSDGEDSDDSVNDPFSRVRHFLYTFCCCCCSSVALPCCCKGRHDPGHLHTQARNGSSKRSQYPKDIEVHVEIQNTARRRCLCCKTTCCSFNNIVQNCINARKYVRDTLEFAEYGKRNC